MSAFFAWDPIKKFPHDLPFSQNFFLNINFIILRENFLKDNIEKRGLQFLARISILINNFSISSKKLES